MAFLTSFIVPVKPDFPVGFPALVSMMSHIPLWSGFFRTIWPLIILSFFIFLFCAFFAPPGFIFTEIYPCLSVFICG